MRLLKLRSLLFLLLSGMILVSCSIDIDFKDKTVIASTLDPLDPNAFSFDSNQIQLSGNKFSLKPIELNQSGEAFSNGEHLGSSYANGKVGLSGSDLTELNAAWTPRFDNLVGYWKMDGDWLDASGNGHDGVPAGAPNTSASAKIGTASGEFDGANDSVDVGTMMPKSYTKLAWIKLTTPGLHNNIFSGTFAKTHIFWTPQNDCGAGGPRLAAGQTGGGSGVFCQVKDPKVLPLDTWIHGAVTYNSATQVMRLFKNGRLVDQKSEVPNFDEGTDPDFLGGFASNFQFGGLIDDMAIFNGPLSVGEINTIYQRQKQKYSGTYKSEILDTGDKNFKWPLLGWKTNLPYGKGMIGDKDANGTTDSDSSTSYPDVLTTLNDGLIGYWPFEESQAGGLPDMGNGPTDTEDRGPFSFHGTQLGNLEFGGQGVVGKAPEFDGVDDGIELTGHPQLPLYNHPAFSLSLWVKGRGTQADERIFAETLFGDARPVFAFGTHGAGTYNGIRFYYRGDTNNVFLSTNSNSTPMDGEWHSLIITDANGDLKLYVDGKLDTANLSYTRPASVTLDRTVVGSMGAAAHFEGSIDELAMWTRILTPEEIQQVFRRGANRLKFQVKTCVDSSCNCKSFGTAPPGSLNDCDGDGIENANDYDDIHLAEFSGPGGDGSTYFSEVLNREPELVTLTCASDANSSICSDKEISVAGSSNSTSPLFSFEDYAAPIPPVNNRFLQYRVHLEGDENSACNGETCLPELTSVSLGEAGKVRYFGLSSVESAKPIIYRDLQSLRIEGESCVSVQLSQDQQTYYFWNGTRWATAEEESDRSTIEETQDQFVTFSNQFPGGQLFLKIFLASDSTSTCELGKVDLRYRSPID